jgi:tRNA A37 threonylcarbamoyladenosine synthetase subunit TsaC/SUA5/YrdC
MNTKLYLTQTDTTIGFVSQDATKIDNAKRRLPNKHYICTVDSLKRLRSLTRSPQDHKNRIRRAKRTTFVMPNGRSFRVVKESRHNLLLDRAGWFYSSSANLSGEIYDEDYAKKQCEVLVAPLAKDQREASKIYRLGSNKRLYLIR